MNIEKEKLLFYLAVGIGTIILEIAIIYGAGICVMPPILFSILFIGWKVFPKEKPSN